MPPLRSGAGRSRLLLRRRTTLSEIDRASRNRPSGTAAFPRTARRPSAWAGQAADRRRPFARSTSSLQLRLRLRAVSAKRSSKLGSISLRMARSLAVFGAPNRQWTIDPVGRGFDLEVESILTVPPACSSSSGRSGSRTAASRGSPRRWRRCRACSGWSSRRPRRPPFVSDTIDVGDARLPGPTAARDRHELPDDLGRRLVGTDTRVDRVVGASRRPAGAAPPPASGSRGRGSSRRPRRCPRTSP